MALKCYDKDNLKGLTMANKKISKGNDVIDMGTYKLDVGAEGEVSVSHLNDWGANHYEGSFGTYQIHLDLDHDYSSLQSQQKFLEPEGNPRYKYKEDKILKEVGDYIASTYKGHYVRKGELQTTDIWEMLGSAGTTARDTAIKYLMRYGKKEGYNKKDLLKAIHYIVLLYYYTQENERNDDSSGKQEKQFLSE